MKIKKQDVTIFFRTMAVTAVCILCLAVGWSAVCAVFEEAQSRLCGDTRPAVVLDKGYLKIFEFEFNF